MPFLKPIIGKDNGITLISARPIPATVVNSPNCVSSPECTYGVVRVVGWMLGVNHNVHYTMVRSLDFIPRSMGKNEGT